MNMLPTQVKVYLGQMKSDKPQEEQQKYLSFQRTKSTIQTPNVTNKKL